MKIGNRLRTFREKNNITQAQIADKLGITQGAVSQWEAGATNPSIATISKLAAILGCSIDELLGIEKNNHREDERL